MDMRGAWCNVGKLPLQVTSSCSGQHKGTLSKAQISDGLRIILTSALVRASDGKHSNRTKKEASYSFLFSPFTSAGVSTITRSPSFRFTDLAQLHNQLGLVIININSIHTLLVYQLTWEHEGPSHAQGKMETLFWTVATRHDTQRLCMEDKCLSWLHQVKFWQ